MRQSDEWCRSDAARAYWLAEAIRLRALVAPGLADHDRRPRLSRAVVREKASARAVASIIDLTGDARRRLIARPEGVA